jgi:ribosome maturation factor RimP
MICKDTVIQIVTDFLSDTNCYFVEATVSAENFIKVEIDCFAGVDIDFCAKLSRHIEGLLDREKEDFELEVGSSGLTEPFKTLKQYEKNIGNEVEILTGAGKKLRGILESADEEKFTVAYEEMEKTEGKKKKVAVKKQLILKYNEIKHVKYNLRF